MRVTAFVVHDDVSYRPGGLLHCMLASTNFPWTHFFSNPNPSPNHTRPPTTCSTGLTCAATSATPPSSCPASTPAGPWPAPPPTCPSARSGCCWPAPPSAPPRPGTSASATWSSMDTSSRQGGPAGEVAVAGGGGSSGCCGGGAGSCAAAMEYCVNAADRWFGQWAAWLSSWLAVWLSGFWFG